MVHHSPGRASRRRGGEAQLVSEESGQGPETARVLRRLADLVEDSDLRWREIETRAGFSRGYLSRLLSGRAELKVWHVSALLSALGLEKPPEFFAALYPRRHPAALPVTAAGLRVNADVVCIYSLGIEAIEQLRARLAVCERALYRWLALVEGERGEAQT